MLGRGRSNIWVYDKYATNVLSHDIYVNYSHRPWKMYFLHTSHFLISPYYYSTFGCSMRVSFCENLNDHYYEYHGVGKFLQRLRPRPCVWDNIAFTSGNGSDLVGRDW